MLFLKLENNFSHSQTHRLFFSKNSSFQLRSLIFEEKPVSDTAYKQKEKMLTNPFQPVVMLKFCHPELEVLRPEQAFS